MLQHNDALVAPTMQIFLSLLATPHYHAFCFLLVSSAVAEALIAIWAGTTRLHWFWRALAVWAGAAALVPIRAIEFAGIMAITLPIIAVAILRIERWRRQRQQQADSAGNHSPPGRIRFPLRDIFILVLISALITAAVLHWWRAIEKIGPP